MKEYLKDREIQKNLKKVEAIKNAANLPHYQLKLSEDYTVNILIDNTLEHGRFRPSPLEINTWYATSQTFRSMKKDIFALDEESLDLKDEIECKSCSKILDKQFWNLCPYCLKEL